MKVVICMPTGSEYDLDVSDFPDEGEEDKAAEKEAELEKLVASPGWRAVW